MRRLHAALMLAALVLAALVLAGCVAAPGTPPPSQPPACLLPSEQPMLVAELFFGRNVRGRGPVSDAEWAEFATQAITPAFPDGFTVLDGEGQWRNPATGAIARERSKILVVAVPRGPDLAARLIGVIDAYRGRFRQQSVGIITRDACAAF